MPPKTCTHVHLGVFCNTAVTDWYKGPACPRPLLCVYTGNVKSHSISEEGGALATGKYCFWGFRTPVVGWRKMAVDSRILELGSCHIAVLWRKAHLDCFEKFYHWRLIIEGIEKLKKQKNWKAYHWTILSLKEETSELLTPQTLPLFQFRGGRSTVHLTVHWIKKQETSPRCWLCHCLSETWAPLLHFLELHFPHQ